MSPSSWLLQNIPKNANPKKIVTAISHSKSLVIHLLVGINELIRIVNSRGLLATPQRSEMLIVGRPWQDSGDMAFVIVCLTGDAGMPGSVADECCEIRTHEAVGYQMIPGS